MAKETFRYTIHRVGVKKVLKRGEIKKKKLEQVVRAIQRKIKKIVVKQHVPLFVRIWNAEDETERFEKQYDHRRDFKSGKRPKWRRELSEKVKRSRKFDPSVKHIFVAVGKRGQFDLTWLSHVPTKQSLMRKKKKKLFGPFTDEASAQAFIDKVRARVDERQTEFSQRRRYKGPMEEP